jgi:hypothetical protein
MALNVVWHGAPDDLHGVEGLRRLTALAMVGCATWLIARGIHRVSASYLARLPIKEADNLQARRLYTQTRVLSRTGVGLVILVGTAMALMTFPPCVRWAPACWPRPAWSASWPALPRARCWAT